MMNGSVPVKVAARVYGKDACWVRAGIIDGWLPIGVATESKSKAQKTGTRRKNYYISPKLLYEHTGYEWNGEKE